MARPSRPSVRFTALEKPTIQKYATSTNTGPSGKAKSFSSGTNSVVALATSALRYSHSAAANPSSDCNAYFQRAGRPRLSFNTSLR